MSVVVARFERDAVLMIADTAVTNLRLNRPWRHTSFGEAELDCPHVVEAGVKLIQVGNVLIGYVGSIDSALGFVEALRNRLRPNDVAASVRRTLGFCGPPGLGNDADFMCSWPCGRRVKLIQFSLGCQAITEICASDTESGCAMLGSLRGAPGQLWTDSVVIPSAEQLCLRDLLAATLAAAQNHGIHTSTMPLGVGGAYVGASVTTRGIAWQPIVTHLFTIDGTPHFDEFTTVAIKDGFILIATQDRFVQLGLEMAGRASPRSRPSRESLTPPFANYLAVHNLRRRALMIQKQVPWKASDGPTPRTLRLDVEGIRELCAASSSSKPEMIFIRPTDRRQVATAN